MSLKGIKVRDKVVRDIKKAYHWVDSDMLRIQLIHARYF